MTAIRDNDNWVHITIRAKTRTRLDNKKRITGYTRDQLIQILLGRLETARKETGLLEIPPIKVRDRKASDLKKKY